MRTFLGIDLHSTEKILEIQNLIVNKYGLNEHYVRPIPKNNLHITLKFLGEISDDQVKVIISKLQNLKFNSFEARFVSVDCFPNCINPNIIWLKLEDQCIKQINTLYRLVSESLASEEYFKLESRDASEVEKFDFNPHLTIFRIKRKTPFQKYFNFSHDNIYYNTEIDQVKLKKSTLTSGGPIYSDLITIEAASRK